MRINKFFIVGLCCLMAAESFSHESTTVEVSLSELVKIYSDEHGTNMLFKASLNRTLKITEEDLTGIDAPTFLDILTCNGLVALEKGDLVFIMSVEDSVTLGDNYEGRWRG